VDKRPGLALVAIMPTVEPTAVKYLVLAAAVLPLLLCSAGTNAKVFDYQHLPANLQRLENADSFSVECRNDQTGVIDRESVDVDAATVTVEIPGTEPVVHRISHFGIDARQVQDRFGQVGEDLYLDLVQWGRSGNTMIGMMISNGRWLSHHEDDSWWTCAN
jgi:hypothetical protein